MKSLIVFSSKYGTTESCVKSLSNKIEGEYKILDLDKNLKEDINRYDKVIIGTSVFIGKGRKSIVKFCNENLELLKTKKVYIFMCCMAEGDVLVEQLNRTFDKSLLEKVIEISYFGAEYKIKEMSFIDRMIVKKVAKITTDFSNVSQEKIIEFSKKINIT